MGAAMDHTDFVGRIDVTPPLNDDEAASSPLRPIPHQRLLVGAVPRRLLPRLDRRQRAGVAGGLAALPAHRPARVRPSARRRAGRVPAGHRRAVLGLGREQPGAREGAARRIHDAQVPRSGVRRSSGRARRSSTSPPTGLPPVSAQAPARSFRSARIVVDLAPQGEVPGRRAGAVVRSGMCIASHSPCESGTIASSRPCQTDDRDGDRVRRRSPIADHRQPVVPPAHHALLPRLPAEGVDRYVGDLAGEERPRRPASAGRPGLATRSARAVVSRLRPRLAGAGTGGTSMRPGRRPRTPRRSPAPIPSNQSRPSASYGATPARWRPPRQRPGRIAAQASARGPPPDQPRVSELVDAEVVQECQDVHDVVGDPWPALGEGPRRRPAVPGTGVGDTSGGAPCGTIQQSGTARRRGRPEVVQTSGKALRVALGQRLEDPPVGCRAPPCTRPCGHASAGSGLLLLLQRGRRPPR